MKKSISLFALILTVSHISLTPPPPPMPSAKAVMPMPVAKMPVPAPAVAMPVAKMPVPGAPVAAPAAAPVVAQKIVTTQKPQKIPLNLANVKILHTGNVPITVTSCTISYSFEGDTKVYTWKPKLTNKSTTNGLSNTSEIVTENKKVSVPKSLLQGHSYNLTGVRVSSLTINGDVLLFSAPKWSAFDSGSNFLYIKTQGGKIVPDEATMKKAANNGGTLPKDAIPTTPTPTTTAPAPVAQTPQNPSPTTKAAGAVIVNSNPSAAKSPKKSKAGKSTKKVIATTAAA